MSETGSRPVVNLDKLAKTFTVKHKAAGLQGSLRALWKPESRQVAAVSSISFSLEEG